MNAMTTQLFSSLIECRERAHVVSISNPEYTPGPSADKIILLLVILVAVIAVVVLIVKLVSKNRADAAAMGKTAVQASSVTGASQQPPAAKVTCASCGASIPKVSKFCPKCGANRSL